VLCCVVQVFPKDALNSSLGGGAAQAHLRSKETLLALLHARILDKVSQGHKRRVRSCVIKVPCLRERERESYTSASCAAHNAGEMKLREDTATLSLSHVQLHSLLLPVLTCLLFWAPFVPCCTQWFLASNGGFF